MELLIPGLILVGLMVYASTRIKRNAAKAFDEETIETNDFTLRKAEGMLHVLNGDPRYAFEAYSKEFGTAGRRDARLATAAVQILAAPDDGADEERISELSEVIGDVHYQITEARRIRDGAEFRIVRKIGEKNGQTIMLEVAMLEGIPDEFRNKLERMVDSFVVIDTSK